jgi:hypothetical protein
MPQSPDASAHTAVLLLLLLQEEPHQDSTAIASRPSM